MLYGQCIIWGGVVIMTDRPISPQGYDITKDPKNYNPFWGDDTPVDPSVYERLDDLEADVADLEETKADIADIPDLTDYYTKTQTDSLLAQKADTATTYTKTEVDNQLATKINIGALNAYYNKTDIDNMLSNYAETSDLPDMTNYYTKTEIDATIGNIQSILEVI